jgi:hypothetical protein
MTGKQTAVIWIGLIIVILNLVSQWSSIKSIIFGGSSSSSSTPSSGGTSTTTPGGITVNPPGGGVTIPFGGFPITVPLSASTANPSVVLA